MWSEGILDFTMQDKIQDDHQSVGSEAKTHLILEPQHSVENTFNVSFFTNTWMPTHMVLLLRSPELSKQHNTFRLKLKCRQYLAIHTNYSL